MYRSCDNCKNGIFIKRCDQRFCCDDCRIEFHKSVKLSKLKEIAKDNPLPLRKCPYCEKVFTPSRRCNFGQRFCSKKCKVDQHAANQRVKREERRKQAKRSCPICDKTFSPKRSLKEIYCSKRCRESIGKRVYKMMQSCYDSTNTHKENRTHKTLGYSPKQLLEHLQSFGQWDQLKHGQWHLDHKFPIVAFTRKGIKDIKLICCLENLQPLSGSRNCSKGDNYDEAEFETWLAAQN